MEEGVPMGDEAGAGGGMDEATTLGARDGAFPAIETPADDAGGGGGRR